ncbi:MAG: hypothetical protein PHP17_00905 [Candidatus Omnitrophica bacterium]|nr:hypothetical protein [Candidatus Omnitrophota bacterium]
MKKLIFIVFCFLLSAAGLNAAAQEEGKYKITPIKDSASPTGIYIPENIEDCFKELRKILSPVMLEEMKQGKESDMAKYHRSLGMWMRNNWGLWSGSRLKDYFNGLGIQHPDDMSGIILTSLWRNLNNKPIELKQQIQYYQNYWKKVKEKGN